MGKKSTPPPAGLLIIGAGSDSHGLSLFHEDDLIGAAEECQLKPLKGASAEAIAGDLSRKVPAALNLGQSQVGRPSRDNRLDQLNRIQRSAAALLQALDIDVPIAPQRIPTSALNLLRPGLSEPPAISLTAKMIALAGGLDALNGSMARARELVQIEDGDANAVADAEQRALDCAGAEAVLALLPQAVSLVGTVAERAMAVIEAENGAGGRKKDDDTPIVLRAMADAHTMFFGYLPVLREKRDRDNRDTPSMRWIRKVLECGAARAPRTMGGQTGQIVPEADRLHDIANLSVYTINDRLSAVLRGN